MSECGGGGRCGWAGLWWAWQSGSRVDPSLPPFGPLSIFHIPYSMSTSSSAEDVYASGSSSSAEEAPAAPPPPKRARRPSSKACSEDGAAACAKRCFWCRRRRRHQEPPPCCPPPPPSLTPPPPASKASWASRGVGPLRAGQEHGAEEARWRRVLGVLHGRVQHLPRGEARGRAEESC